MVFLIGRKIAVGFLIALAVVIAIGTVARRNFQKTNEGALWVTRSIEVLLNLRSLEAVEKDSTVSVRLLLASGAPLVAEHIADTEKDMSGILSTVRQLTTDNPQQQERLDRIQQLFTSRHENFRRLLAMRGLDSSSRPGSATATIMQEEARLNHETETAIRETVLEEQRLLSMRQMSAAEMVAFTSALITDVTLAAVIIVMIVGWVVARSITRPLKTLSAGAGEIGRGNYAYRVPVETQDEVGQLAQVFN